MTTRALPDPPPPDVIARAAELLEVAPEAPKPAVRAAFFHRLRETDFLPAPLLPHAYRLLSEQTGYNPIHWAGDPSVSAEEEHLREEVETFAVQFYTFPVEERRRRWQELVTKCAGMPRVAARVEGLQPGLAVEFDRIPDNYPRVKDLATKVLELSVLRPAERAMRRQEWLNSLRSDMSGVERAARRLRNWHPPLTALEPTLIDHLGQWRSRQKRIAKAQRPKRPFPIVGRPFIRLNDYANRHQGMAFLLLLTLFVGGGLALGIFPNKELSQTTKSSTEFSPPSRNGMTTEQQRVIEQLLRAKTPEERERIANREKERLGVTELREKPRTGTTEKEPR